MLPAVTAPPLPSTTVILLRDEPAGDEPFSVLLAERHGSIAFPGAHAFPGGVLEPGDHAGGAACLPGAQRWADASDGDTPADALPYWVAGVRELFEEVGILLAADGDRLLQGPLAPDLAALRAPVFGGEPLVAALGRVGLRPATETLLYFARWITPVVNPKRFDTRFLVGRAPEGQEPVADGTETVSCKWLGPRAALAAYEEGHLAFFPPTVRTLADLTFFASVDMVLSDAAGRMVRPFMPEIAQDDGAPTLQYPDVSGRPGVAPRRLTLRDGRWRPS
jgi:8-oxo-dGTP pyrophosphatase MutT (NUDIX family)